MFYKAQWFLRGIFYKPFFGKFGFPSYIGKPVYLGSKKNIFVGNQVRIFPGARIEVVNDSATIRFEDNVAIGQNLHITSGCELIVSSGTTIAGDVAITNIDHDYRKIGESIIDQQYIIKETKIGKNCYLGRGVMIQAGTVLGEQCVVGANSVVRGEFPDYCVIAGAPAKIVKKYNSISKVWER